LGQTAALYCRVSTVDQNCVRQERDLRAFAKKAGYKIVGVWKETASGAKDDRAERKAVLALAQARKVDVILVTELTRWGRSMLDLFRTLALLPVIQKHNRPTLVIEADKLAARKRTFKAFGILHTSGSVHPVQRLYAAEFSCVLFSGELNDDKVRRACLPPRPQCQPSRCKR
jgi:DNA invertase Pin-like site-specific DNA recombinase